MELAAKLDDCGKTAWVAVMVVGFIVFWPVGLAILAYLIWSGRMAFWKCGGPGRWHNEESRRNRNGWRSNGRHAETSGNSAFDEYREETLQRLEEEQQEFRDFLERLRHAKDKAEFDAFMADRRNRPTAPDAGHTPDGPVPQPQV